MSDEHHDVNYKKIYFILLGLLGVSVVGPFLEIMWVTLITAFGIAIVKANLVIQNFMHLRWEKRLMKWMLTTSVVLMALMVAGIAPDVLNHEGNNWENLAAKAAVERGIDSGEGEEVIEIVDVEPGVFNAETSFGIVCAVCHGASGLGDGPAGLALDPPPADFNELEFWAERDEERIFNVIRDGAASVGGSPLMVPWRNSFDDEQIQALADYVIATFRPDAQ
jgi:caa(3)-type oxidase subunit IV